MDYSPDKDPGVLSLLSVAGGDERLAAEQQLLQDTDNGLKPTDPGYEHELPEVEPLYDPVEDVGVIALARATNEDERLRLEALLIEDTDNGTRSTDTDIR